MANQIPEIYDVIIAGAGVGGLSTGTLLAKAGYSVLILEAGHVAGGCSSSYYRKGRVGGIPQSMSRSLLDWNQTGLHFQEYFCAEILFFPEQGIPGVTLSGINVYLRVLKYLNKNYKRD